MDAGKAGKITTRQILFTFGIIAAVEICIVQLPFDPLVKTGIARCLEIVFILLLFQTSDRALASIGLSKDLRLKGVKKGLIWSAGFALMAFLGGGMLFFAGINPFKLFYVGLPATKTNLVLFYIVGGFIAPVAEEIFFRGILYGYLKGALSERLHQWSIPAALIISTVFFVTAHQGSFGIAWPQLIGGIVFCLSFEIEKSLLTPIVIHSTGNLALFTLSFLQH